MLKNKKYHNIRAKNSEILNQPGKCKFITFKNVFSRLYDVHLEYNVDISCSLIVVLTGI